MVRPFLVVIEGARGTRRRQNLRKNPQNPVLGVFSPRDPENRVQGEILHILVVGELRGMVLKRLYDGFSITKFRMRYVFCEISDQK